MRQLDSGFVISSMADMNSKRANILSAMDIDQLLQQKLKTSDYSDKIKKIGFVFIALDPKKSKRENNKVWRWKSSVFEMYVNVPDYKKFCKSTEAEARKIIAKLFLSSLETYLSKRKDINYKQLYVDVKEQFVKGGVL